MAKLSETTVEYIYQTYHSAKKVGCEYGMIRIMAKMIGIHESQVSQIVNGKAWVHITKVLPLSSTDNP